MPEKDIEAIVGELIRRITEHGRRLRALEERNTINEMRMDSIEEGLLKISENVKQSISANEQRIKGFENELFKVRTDINKLNKLIEKTAKKTEVKEVENMISLFNPLKSQFVTRDEMKRIIKE